MKDITFDMCLRNCVMEYPNEIGMTDLDNEFTWNEINQITNVVASKLRSRGIKKGDHVAIWATNSAHWVIDYFAIQRLGAIAVLINVAFKWRELESILEKYDINYILYTRKYKESDHENTINMLDRDKFVKLKGTFIIDDIDYDLRALLKEKNEDIIVDINPNDVCSILFTSGTTGIAKGAMLTHNNLVKNAKAIVDRMEWKSEDRMCLAVPMFHCFGITVGMIGAMHTGATMDIARKFSTGTVFKLISEKKCTLFNGVPTMFLAMMNSSKREMYDISSLKGGLMAGSPILPLEYLDICKAFGFEYLQTAFGQTESSPAITTSLINDSVDCKAYTAGTALDGVEVRIRKEDGTIAEVNEEAEIQTRGYHVMKGYYNLPEETNKAISEDGWLSTGDLGYLDENGYLHVTGRIKDIIVRGGENIAPMEIENVIIQLDEIKAVKVVGIKAKVIQEEVVACIQWRDDRRVPLDDIKKLVSNQLADYKVPRYILEFEHFPKNSSNKVLGKELVKMCEEKLNEMAKNQA